MRGIAFFGDTPEEASWSPSPWAFVDTDTAGAEGARAIADLFLKAGLSVPLKLAILAGRDLKDFMKKERTA